MTQQYDTFGVWNLGVRPMPPKFELGRNFCKLTAHIVAKFHHPV